jgi:hypothetical protein
MNSTVYYKGKVYASWNDARTYVRSLGLAGQKDWLDWRSTVQETWCIPIKIPRVPKDVYRSQWQGLRDWLGLDEVSACIFCFVSSDTAQPTSTTRRGVARAPSSSSSRQCRDAAGGGIMTRRNGDDDDGGGEARGRGHGGSNFFFPAQQRTQIDKNRFTLLPLHTSRAPPPNRLFFCDTLGWSFPAFN